MASITTQIISKAASGAVATVAQVVREAVQVARPQLQKASRVEADKVTISPRREDGDRTPAQPKQTEATYSRPRGKPPSHSRDEGDDGSPPSST